MLQTIRKMAHPVSPVVNSQIVAGSQISTGPTGTSVRKKQKNPSRRAPGTPAIQKADGCQNGLREVRPDDAVHHALQGARRDNQQTGAAPTRQPFQYGAECRCGALAVTIQEEGDQQADEDFHHIGADQGAEGQDPGARDLNIGLQLGGHLNAACGQVRPELVQLRPQQRQRRHPGWRLRNIVVSPFLKLGGQLCHVLSQILAEQGERESGKRHKPPRSGLPPTCPYARQARASAGRAAARSRW